MKESKSIRWYVVFLILLGFKAYEVSAQCPNVYDQNGEVVAEPYWISCSGGAYTLSLLPTANWSNYSINWGDGSTNTSGTNWSSPTLIQHTYSATVDTFVVTISNPLNNCEVQGVVVMEQATNASIQVPLGAYTQICAPDVVEFINSSTNVSQTTQFIWDFGDGTTPLQFDYTNFNQVVTHLYDENGNYNCETTVSLTAENYCNVLQGSASVATFTPVNIWTLDEASIGVSASTQCNPNTTFTFTNTTIRNCLNQGNTFQRQEKWNFGNYFGTGQDSVTNWTPWPPSISPIITFPGIGDYTVTLYDSSYCGVVEQTVTVHVIAPPVSNIAATTDTVCVGQQTTFLQLGNVPGQSYQWNVGVNGAWSNLGSGNVTYTYNNPGTYTVRCRAYFPQYGSASCADTASFIIEVLPSPTISISANDLQACDSITTDLNAVSNGGVNFEWDLGSAGNFSGQNPDPISFYTPGNYPVVVTVTGLNGCSNSDSETINVYATPVASFTLENACEGAMANFLNTSQSAAGNPIVSTSWSFGDGGNSNSNNPNHTYNSQGDFIVSLNISTPFCSSSTQDTITVYPLPVAGIIQDIQSGCQPVEVNFTNTSSGATAYSWNFDDGTFSSDTNVVHSFYHSGTSDYTFNVELTATNEFGCSDIAITQVVVNGGAVASFNSGETNLGCDPSPIQFENLSENATTFEWNFGDGSTSIDPNPAHTFINNSGFIEWYEVQLIANSNEGCSDTTVLEIPVYPILDIQVPTTVYEGCSPFVFESPTFVGVQGFQWNFGDGT
ncbi:MAG: PKD domain-containing protein, partial [Bacteroidota bacterium]